MDKNSVNKIAGLLVASTKCYEEGECPYCGSDDIEYDGGENMDGEAMGYGFTCNECGECSTEWYNLNYVETISDHDENVKCEERGECPYCHNDDLEYDDYDVDGGTVKYGFTCNKCKKSSTEYYNLDYVETVGDDDEDFDLDKLLNNDAL